MNEELGEIVLSPFEETNSRLAKPNALAFIHNFVTTREGGVITCRATRSFFPFLTIAPLSKKFENALSVCYTELAYGRKVLLVHDDDAIRVYGPTGFSTLLDADKAVKSAPAQFIPVPNGVIIVPPQGRAHFYDGDVVAPLGFEARPAPPVGHGPMSSKTNGEADIPPVPGAGDFPTTGTNDVGLVSDGLTGWAHSSSPAFMYGRLGTVVTFQGDMASSTPGTMEGLRGTLLPGRYRAVTQLVDMWGNYSPLSGPSNDVVFDQQPSKRVVWDGSAYVERWQRADAVRKRALWTNIAKGPNGTVARLVGRTRDLGSAAGDGTFYELPINCADVIGALGTVPDNVSTQFPDNVPDAWLITPLVDRDPVPRFSLGDHAFGRLWVGGIEGDESAIMVSEPGLWGTFPRNSRRWPDSSGRPITMIKAALNGVVVASRTTTFFYQSDRSNPSGFTSVPISKSFGCVAHASAVPLSDGRLVWLGEDGFYQFDGSQVTRMWDNHPDWSQRLTRTALHKAHAVFDPVRREYLCWVPADGRDEPSMCWVYDGVAWRTRDEEAPVRGSCVVGRDIFVTTSGDEGLRVLNKGQYVQDAYIDTGWLNSFGPPNRVSGYTISIRLREVSDESKYSDTARQRGMRLTVMRDYRKEVVHTSNIPVHAKVVSGPVPSTWGDTSGSEALWRDRGFFWVKADFFVPSANTMRLKLECFAPVEIADIMIAVKDDMARDKVHR